MFHGMHSPEPWLTSADCPGATPAEVMRYFNTHLVQALAAIARRSQISLPGLPPAPPRPSQGEDRLLGCLQHDPGSC